MKLHLTALVLALASGSVFAASVDGLKPVADGLYASYTKDGATFVPTNNAGRLALAAHIDALKQQQAARLGADGLNSFEQDLIERLEQSAQTLKAQASQKAYDSDGGTCGNGNTLSTIAIAQGGYLASASAVNALDFGPATPTTNVASAYNDFSSDYSVQYGLTAAAADVNDYGSCISVAEASVTCPGNSYPSSYAFTYSSSRARHCAM